MENNKNNVCNETVFISEGDYKIVKTEKIIYRKEFVNNIWGMFKLKIDAILLRYKDKNIGKMHNNINSEGKEETFWSREDCTYEESKQHNSNLCKLGWGSSIDYHGFRFNEKITKLTWEELKMEYSKDWEIVGPMTEEEKKIALEKSIKKITEIREEMNELFCCAYSSIIDLGKEIIWCGYDGDLKLAMDAAFAYKKMQLLKSALEEEDWEEKRINKMLEMLERKKNNE